MAFLSRSERDTTLIRATSTLPRVGPGSYDVPRLLDQHTTTTPVHYVPFGSGSGRSPFIIPNQVPAPGSYLDPIRWESMESASWNAFKSSTPRFPNPIDEQDAQRPIGIDHRPWGGTAAPSHMRRPMVRLTTTTTIVPSIPANSFGYVLGPNGSLQPRPPPEPKPATSDSQPSPGSCRGTSFGRGADRWRPGAAAAASSPGPGQYDPVDPGRMQFDQGKATRRTSCFAARTARPDPGRAEGPGPGQYDAGAARSSSSWTARPARFQDFGCRTRRWVEPADDDDIGPGPGSYHPDRTPQYIRLRPPPVPFNALSERFPEPMPALQPGPQDYTLPSSIRKVAASKVEAPFGSRRQRFEAARPNSRPASAAASVTTTPSEREPRRGRGRPRCRPAWRSIVANPKGWYRQPPRSSNMGPAPGAYEVDRMTTAFRSERYKAKGFQFAPRTSISSRRQQIVEPLIADLSPIPGAATARSRRPTLIRKPMIGTSSFRSQVDRFANDPTVAIRNRNPGPGEYGDLRPNFLKRTFNVTIDPEFDRIPAANDQARTAIQ